MKKSIVIGAISLLLALSASGQIPNTLTPADKLYGLSTFWQEVNYNFVYLNRVDRAAWDNRYKELLATITNTKNDYEYYRELQKFCASLKDGHTNVYFPKEIQPMTTMFGEYRLFLKNIDGKAIVTRTNFSKKDEIPVGSEIIEVNGLPTQAYIDEFVAPYIASSTDYVLEDWSVIRLLNGLEGDQFHIKIRKPDTTVMALSITHRKTEETEVYPPFEENFPLLDLKWMEQDIALLTLNSFDNPLIDTLFIEKLPELYKAKALIIDLRNNGGGSTGIGLEILKYLTHDTILYGAQNTSRMHIPTYKAWGSFLTPQDTLTDKPEWGMNKEEMTKSYLMGKDDYPYVFPYVADTIQLDARRIVVPTAVLIGHNTASAAEDFLIYADNQKHFTKFGDNTFGSTGQPYLFDMPGGGRARVCTKKDTYPNGVEFVGVGIIPEVVVRPTLQDYQDKKDPVLEKAVAFLKQQKK
jgi:C-terminal processing protease CtpA/Prc